MLGRVAISGPAKRNHPRKLWWLLRAEAKPAFYLGIQPGAGSTRYGLVRGRCGSLIIQSQSSPMMVNPTRSVHRSSMTVSTRTLATNPITAPTAQRTHAAISLSIPKQIVAQDAMATRQTDSSAFPIFEPMPGLEVPISLVPAMGTCSGVVIFGAGVRVGSHGGDQHLHDRDPSFHLSHPFMARPSPAGATAPSEWSHSREGNTT